MNFPKRPKRFVFPQNGQALDRVKSMSLEDLNSPNETGFYTPRATITKEKETFQVAEKVDDNAEKLTSNETNSKSPPSYCEKDFDSLPRKNPSTFSKMRETSSFGSLNEARVQFALSQTPPMSTTGRPAASTNKSNQNMLGPGGNNTSHHTLSPVIQCFTKE